MVKEKIILARLDDPLYNEIDRFSKDKGWSKSKLTRLALQEYLFIYGTPVSYVVTSRIEFKYLLKCLNEEQVKELAKLGYANADKFRGDYLLNTYLNIDEDDILKLGVKRNLSVLIRYMFAPEGQRLFNEINSIWKGKWVIIYGKHENGINFSIYFKYFMIDFLKPFDFQLIKEKIEEELIILEFKHSEEITKENILD